MFMLKSLGRLVSGESQGFDLIEIPNGMLYLIRPQSPKGCAECIFKDAVATIRRTGTQFLYQLVIQRAYGEGEEQLDDDSSQEEQDEKAFLLDKQLELRIVKIDNIPVIAWNDLYGDDNDVYEFVCADENMHSIVKKFEKTVLKCVYERETKSSSDNVSEAELEKYHSTEPVPPINMTALSRTSSISTRSNADSRSNSLVQKTQNDLHILCTVYGELHLYNVENDAFMSKDEDVRVEIFDCGDFNFVFNITSQTDGTKWITQKIEAEINPVFSFEYCSFIWNFYDDDKVYSWLLKFQDVNFLQELQTFLMKASWENLNRQKWSSMAVTDQKYYLEAYGEGDASMQDYDYSDESSSDYTDAQSADSSNEDFDDMKNGAFEDDLAKNSLLAVGKATDRSFVVRGNKIGVFKQSRDNKLEFVNTISSEVKGLSSPKQVLLHEQDRALIIQNPDDPHSLYKMDIERGEIVETWKANDHINIANFGPNSKFAQATDEKSIVALSHNAIFRIDPRLPGNKMVDGEFKQYTVKNDFSALATAENGWLAIASNKGEIRLFDRIGINAKTALPAFGEPVIALDVSADGRWVLATCKTYLLLVDTTIKDGKYKGHTGFQKSFGKDSKPAPKRLQLNPRHIAMLQTEFKRDQLRFTPAKFNAGNDMIEKSIITSVGPFLITWDFEKVKQGKTDAYLLRRYGDTIQADDFVFNSDSNFVVALPNDVDLTNRSTLRKANRKSLGTPVGKVKSNKDAIVNSPY